MNPLSRWADLPEDAKRRLENLVMSFEVTPDRLERIEDMRLISRELARNIVMELYIGIWFQSFQGAPNDQDTSQKV